MSLNSYLFFAVSVVVLSGYVYTRLEFCVELLIALGCRLAVWIYSWVDVAVERATGRPPIPPKIEVWDTLGWEILRIIRIAEEWMKFAGYWGLALVPVTLALYCSRRSMSRTIRQLRGITFEAMQQGSEFRDGEIPDFQVEIYNAGTFADTFVGYGVRFGAMLVVPTHVMRHVKLLVVSGKTGRLGISVARVQSRLHSDLTYIPITDMQWSMLGVSNARPARKPANILVSCTGRRGTTSGLLTKTDMLGVVKYAGSTVAGMSGAAYCSGQTVYGVHTGVAGDFNVGVSAVLIAAEIKKLVVGETPTLEEMKGLNRAARPRFGWDTAALEKQIDEMYAKDAGWADEIDIDYDEQLQFESEEPRQFVSERWIENFTKMSMSQREAAVRVMQELNQADRIAKGQAPDETPVQMPQDFITLRFTALEQRVDKLEEALKNGPTKRVKIANPGAKPTDSPLPFLCGFEGQDESGAWKCRKGFNTQAAKIQHQIMTGHVKGESAYGTDSKPTLKARPVFRKRRGYWSTSTKNSNSISSSVEQLTPSTSQTPVPSSTPTLDPQTLNVLLESLQGMVGQLSAITQNSKA